MEDAGQCAKPVFRVCHGSFGSIETFFRSNAVAEIIGMDSKQEPGLAILVKLGASDKITAVQEGKAVTSSFIFCGVPVRQNQERIVLVARSTACAAHRLNSMMQRSALAVAFLYVAAIEGVQVIVAVEIIDAYALEVFQINVFAAVVLDADGPRDNVQVFHDAIVEMYIEHLPGILKGDD